MSDRRGRIIPVITTETTVADAVHKLADSAVHGLVLADRRGVPHSVVFPVEILRLCVPEYIVEDPALARVYSPDAARDIVTAMTPRTVKDLIDRSESIVHPLAIVPADATPLEIAAELIRTHVAIAYIKGTQPARFVTVTDVLGEFVAPQRSDDN